jgi:hypothetical protein
VLGDWVAGLLGLFLIGLSVPVTTSLSTRLRAAQKTVMAAKDHRLSLLGDVSLFIHGTKSFGLTMYGTKSFYMGHAWHPSHSHVDRPLGALSHHVSLHPPPRRAEDGYGGQGSSALATGGCKSSWIGCVSHQVILNRPCLPVCCHMRIMMLMCCQVLQGIRAVKAAAWEECMQAKVERARAEELKCLARYIGIKALMALVWEATPTLVG